MDEQVLVVRRSDFFGGSWPQGFVHRDEVESPGLLNELQARGFFVARARAEEDPSLKQLIPYCVLQRSGELFCVERLRQQSEGRLHGMLSLGIGGHVNPADGDRGTALNTALYRELHEEVAVDPELRAQFLGLINDDSTAVGSVHLGLAYAVAVPPGGDVHVRETDKMRGSFRSATELDREHRQSVQEAAPARVVESKPLWQHSAFESWSAIMLEARPWATPRTGEGSRRGGVRREESHDG